MHHVLIFAEPQSEFDKREGPDAPAYWGAWTAYIGAMRQAGVMVSGNGLQPPGTAVTLRGTGGQRTVQDGPFAEAREMIGGYVVIDAPDIEAALEWAARSPAAVHGAVEVRPVLPPPPG